MALDPYFKKSRKANDPVESNDHNRQEDQLKALTDAVFALQAAGDAQVDIRELLFLSGTGTLDVDAFIKLIESKNPDNVGYWPATDSNFPTRDDQVVIAADSVAESGTSASHSGVGDVVYDGTFAPNITTPLGPGAVPLVDKESIVFGDPDKVSQEFEITSDIDISFISIPLTDPDPFSAGASLVIHHNDGPSTNPTNSIVLDSSIGEVTSLISGGAVGTVDLTTDISDFSGVTAGDTITFTGSITGGTLPVDGSGNAVSEMLVVAVLSPTDLQLVGSIAGPVTVEGFQITKSDRPSDFVPPEATIDVLSGVSPLVYDTQDGNITMSAFPTDSAISLSSNFYHLGVTFNISTSIDLYRKDGNTDTDFWQDRLIETPDFIGTGLGAPALEWVDRNVARALTLGELAGAVHAMPFQLLGAAPETQTLTTTAKTISDVSFQVRLTIGLDSDIQGIAIQAVGSEFEILVKTDDDPSTYSLEYSADGGVFTAVEPFARFTV